MGAQPLDADDAAFRADLGRFRGLLRSSGRADPVDAFFAWYDALPRAQRAALKGKHVLVCDGRVFTEVFFDNSKDASDAVVMAGITCPIMEVRAGVPLTVSSKFQNVRVDCTPDPGPTVSGGGLCCCLQLTRDQRRLILTSGLVNTSCVSPPPGCALACRYLLSWMLDLPQS